MGALIEQWVNYWLPTILLFIVWWLGKKYLDKNQVEHFKIVREKNSLELQIRQKESDALINWINLLVKKVTDWNKEILDSNKKHSEEHGFILDFLKERYVDVDDKIVLISWKIDNLKNLCKNNVISNK